MKKIYKLFVVIVFAQNLLMTGSHGAEINLGPTDPTLILVKGDFIEGDDDKFKKIAFNMDHGSVLLDSQGGDIRPALKMGEAIRFKGFETRVINSECSSSCAFVWLAGEPRKMALDANIGFHAVWIDTGNGKKITTGVGNALVGAYLNKLGLNENVIAFVTRSGPNQLERLTKDKADSLGLPVVLLNNYDKAISLHNLAIDIEEEPNRDFKKMSVLYREAANLSFSASQNNLGDMYEKGESLRPNVGYAIYWYTRSAERGEPTAYLSLSTLLEETSSDNYMKIDALKFAILAVKGLPDGRNMKIAKETENKLRNRLSKEEIVEAEKLATAWQPLDNSQPKMDDVPIRK